MPNKSHDELLPLLLQTWIHLDPIQSCTTGMHWPSTSKNKANLHHYITSLRIPRKTKGKTKTLSDALRCLSQLTMKHQRSTGKTTICDSDHSQEAAEDKGYSSNENGLQANLWHPNSRGEISRRSSMQEEKCEKLGFWKGFRFLDTNKSGIVWIWLNHTESFFNTTSSRRPDSKVTRFLVTRLQGPLASGVELLFPWWKCENWNESVLEFLYFERCLRSQYSTRG